MGIYTELLQVNKTDNPVKIGTKDINRCSRKDDMHLWSINYEKALNFISHQDLSEDLKN